MSMVGHIEAKIKATIPDSQVNVHDIMGDGAYHAIEVISESFRGKPRLVQHKIVYEALKYQLCGGRCALALRTGVPEV